MTEKDRSNQTIQKDILSYLANNGHKAYRPKDLAKKLGYLKQKEFEHFRTSVDLLLKEGKVYREKGNRIAHLRKERKQTVNGHQRVGRLNINKQGSGFISVEGGNRYFVSRKHLGKALPKDLVEFKPTGDKSGPKNKRRDNRDRLDTVKIVRVIKRGQASLVGVYQGGKNGGFVDPSDKSYPLAVVVPKGQNSGAKSGDLVQVEIQSFEGWSGSPHGRVKEVLGDKNTKGLDILGLAIGKGIRISFPDVVEKELAKLPKIIRAEDFSSREDFRDENVFTIDPFDAKDFDDAIHIKELGDGIVEVGIHIADVSHYVKSKTALDDEAYSRATSVYLVDRVIPMLPEILSNGLCSLMPKVDRLAHSVIVKLDAKCRVLDFHVAKTIIHSKRRFTYEDAEDILDDKETGPLSDDIKKAWELAKVMRNRRYSEGSVKFASKEYKVVLDDSGAPTHISAKKSLKSHNLVEEFMLLANQLVAQKISDSKVSKGKAIYRVHDKPSEERVVKLLEHLVAFNLDIDTNPTGVDAKDLNRLLVGAQDSKLSTLVQMEVLRSMAKAVYQRDNIGHFGLGFKFYTHFTSPIRRYPDLMVHRMLEGLAPVRQDLDIDQASKHCSEKEREAEQAERDSIKLKKVEYLSARIGEKFSGWITSVIDFGLFVELDDLGIDGLVHITELDDDKYVFMEEQYSLVGNHEGRRYSVGDEIQVYVQAANRGTLKIDFSLKPIDLSSDKKDRKRKRR